MSEYRMLLEPSRILLDSSEAFGGPKDGREVFALTFEFDGVEEIGIALEKSDARKLACKIMEHTEPRRVEALFKLAVLVVFGVAFGGGLGLILRFVR